MKKKVALVLSGGSALGFAHIGVLEVLEKYNVQIDIVVGTSMGGLVGASYCSGMKLKDMIDFACKFKKINFVDINFNSRGLFSGKGVMRNINKFLSDKNIEDCDKIFACVACDLLSEKQIVFSSGSIRDAVRATLSIPGFFVPAQIGDKYCVDGGVVNNLPDDVAKELGADVIISVDVLQNYMQKKKPKNALSTLLTSMNILTKVAIDARPKYSDIVIAPNLSLLTQLSFGKANALKAIKIGRLEAEKHIQEILNIINSN